MGKRPQPRLLIDALTGEWRNGDAGEGRGSELCEPGGLRHQAGGASWRAPHYGPVGRISPGPTRWPPGAERRLVPAKSNLKPQTYPRQSSPPYVWYCPGSHANTWTPTPSNPNAYARLTLLDANASYTSAKVGHPGKGRRPSRALRLPASGSSWHTPAAPFHTP